VVMRLVVVLFAESRDLLPRDNALYHGAYGVGGLLEELEKTAARGGSRLVRSWSAWPRLLALFRLVHQGSHHPALPVPAYGGELFEPAVGGDQATDGLHRALYVFENAAFDTSRGVFPDRDVHRMLEKISRTRVKLRQGRQKTWVTVPVDFSDLSSEYIGILYEGLLDFELKTAPSGDPVIFLAVGNQPALPLSRLEEMDDKALAALLEKMKDTSSGDDEASEEVDEVPDAAEEDGTDDGEEGDEDADDTAEEEGVDTDDDRHVTRTRAEVWARRAVDAGKLVRRPRASAYTDTRRSYEESVSRKASQLVVRVVLPGEWYLVRWGGTRKGSGTFYTRPGLAVPTVQRTLRPLLYDPPAKDDGTPDVDAPASAWLPKRPEEILAIKTCDSACGSGTFPVAVLRYTTDALYAAVHHHGRVADRGDRSVVSLLRARTEDADDVAALGQELIPCPSEDASFEPRLRAVLKRHVVERCIYGVDLDPLAVELCRLSLWIETMDRTLPFSFLDHKVKCGNALVGAWFDQFLHYPVMAWKNREGGDKNHSNGVHFAREARTRALRDFAMENLKTDLKNFLSGPTLFDPRDRASEATEVHADALALLAKLHDLPVQDAAERARIYRDELLGSPAYRSLKAAMDLWCACWFWPAEALEEAPLPSTLSNPSEETCTVAGEIAARLRFFHWELEFPDVFCTEGAGFDSVLGNPPWDTLQPNSKEFFSNIDPLYRAYEKQEALRKQKEYFSNPSIELQWIDFNAGFAAYSNWIKYVALPFGDPSLSEANLTRYSIARGSLNASLHSQWRNLRNRTSGYADAKHPFRHRGDGKAYTYKLFLEISHSLLRDAGRLGLVVPSGIYTDYGTAPLRMLFLDSCKWEWLFGLENRDEIFAIHRSYKFNPIILEKGGFTDEIQVAFMRRNIQDWENAESLSTTYTREHIERFSPSLRSILEVHSRRDLQIMEKVYANSVLLGGKGIEGWGAKYAQGDFNMTSDSRLFPSRARWEQQGYLPDEYSRWIKGEWRPIALLWEEIGIDAVSQDSHNKVQPQYDRMPIPRCNIPTGIILSRDATSYIREDCISTERIERVDTDGNFKESFVPAIALPLYQGKMIWQFDASWSIATGLSGSAAWLDADKERLSIQGKYLIGSWHCNLLAINQSVRVAFRDVQNATNQRTFIGVLIPSFPAGNTVPLMSTGRLRGASSDSALLASLCSFPLDRALRIKMSQNHVNWFYAEELPIPKRLSGRIGELISERICHSFMPGVCFSAAHLYKAMSGHSGAWKKTWALQPHERLRVRSLVDAAIAASYGLDYEELKHFLADCDHPVSRSMAKSFTRNLDQKGFWRVDKDKDPELRHTVLTLIAFHDLEEKIREHGGDRDAGIEAFLSQNNGEGWLLPEAVRLADYGLGHDERALEHQPVAIRLGPRFYDWQLSQSAEESWRECHLHARNLLGEKGYQNLLAEIEAERSGHAVATPPPSVAEIPVSDDQQMQLFS
jgi:hypothetical protein